MNTSVLRAPLLALGLGVLAFGQASAPPTKVAIIHLQNAMAQTKDGQKAAADMETKYGPRRKEIDRKQSEMGQLETQYRNTANTMSPEARDKLARDIDQRRKQIQRDMDDAQAELQQDQDRVLQELGQKMMAVIDRYAADKGYGLILDISSPQNPVLFASNAIDITRDIVELYDRGAGGAAATAPANAAPAIGAPPASAVPPAARPAPVAPRPAAPKK